MGQEQSGAGFRDSDWRMLARTPRCATWQNVRHPAQRIEEYQVHASGSQEVDWLKHIYYLRKNHRSIVGALYLSEQSRTGLCSDSQSYSIFLERIPIRLADIQHVPYPDYLHLYGQCLRGYAELAREVGFFVVEEEYIGVNEEGVVKVWLNEDTSKTHLVGGRVSEGVMVRSIIDAVDQNSDSAMAPHLPNIKNYLYRNADSLTFSQANQQFTQYIQEKTQGEPGRLDCIDLVGGIDVIANRPRDDSYYQPSESVAVLPPTQNERVASVPAEKPVPEQGLTRQHSDVMLSFPPQRQPEPLRGPPPASRVDTPAILSHSSSAKAVGLIGQPPRPLQPQPQLEPPKPPTLKSIPVQNRPKVVINTNNDAPKALPPAFGRPGGMPAAPETPPSQGHQGSRPKLPSQVYFSPPHASQPPQSVPSFQQVFSPQPPRHYSHHSPQLPQAPQIHQAPQAPKAPQAPRVLQPSPASNSNNNHISNNHHNNRQSVPSFLKKSGHDKQREKAAVVENSRKTEDKPQVKHNNVITNSSDKVKMSHNPSHSGSMATSQANKESWGQGGYSPDLLVSFNPGAEVGRRQVEDAAPLAQGSKYKDFNIEEGKSSEEFMRQLQEMKTGSTDYYTPVDYSRWRDGRNSSSETASFMPALAASLGTQPDPYRQVGEAQSQNLIGTYQGIGDDFGRDVSSKLISRPPSFPHSSDVPPLQLAEGGSRLYPVEDSSYSPHRKLLTEDIPQ